MRLLPGWSKPRLVVVLAVFFALAHCDGGGCGGCDTCGMTEIPGGFPANQRIENGIQVRLTSHGIGFVEQNAAAIVADLMPGGLQFEVPPSCDMDATVTTIDICGTGSAAQCDPITPPCLLDIVIEELVVTPQDPPGNVLDVEARVNVQTVQGSHIRTFGSGADCDITIDTTDGGQAYVRVLTSVTFHVDAVSGRTSLEVGELTIPDGDIEDPDIDIDGPLFSWCTAIEWFAEGTLISEITGMLDGIVGPMLEGLCMPCDQGEQCPQLSSCDGSICQEDSGAGCVMPLGMEGRMDVGSLLASISPGKQADLDILAWLGGYATTNDGGVSLGMHGGAMTPTHNECVPLRDPPDLTPAPISSAFQTNTRPTDEADYEVGIGIHKKFLDAAGYAVYDSGMLCLEVGPRESEMLVASTFSILIPSIYDVSHGAESPIVLAVRPQNPLTFELSEQEMTLDPGTGEYEIVTPLMTITSTDFAIDFYALIDYRYVRVFRLNADLAIPVGLTVNGQNQLVPVIGDLSDAFQNLVVTDSYMLEEEPETLAAAFPTLFGLVAGMLAIPPFDLPDMQGFSLVIDEGGITSVDGNSLLAIYANLAYAAPSPKAHRSTVRTTATLLEQYTPPADLFHVHSVADYHGDTAPSVTLELGGTAPERSGADLEWQYRFDGGLWSPFTDASVVTLRRPVMFLQGSHFIEVRARIKGVPSSLDSHPVRVEYVVDAVAPFLTVLRNGSRVYWSASDNITTADALEYSVRFGDGQWSPWQAGLTEQAVTATFSGTVSVRVRDESGNEAQVTEGILGLYGRVTVPPSDSSCSLGCQQGPGGGVAWLMLVIFGLWIVRRRRTGVSEGRPGGRRLPFVVILLALSASGTNCDCGNSSGEEQCPDGGIDLVCTNSDLECVSGQELAGTEPMTLDASSCEPIPVLCECVGDPDQVNPGDYGRFLSVVAQDGDVYVSCYSDRFTDLVVATVEGTGLVPEFVDGVPEGPVMLDPEGYRDGIVARGPNVGTFTSAAIDSAGTVYVSYVDETEGAVKVARGTPGAWDVHEVETYDDENVRPWYTSLQLLGDGRPAVAYMLTGLVDPADPTRRLGQLRYAVAQVADPSDASDWAVEVVDGTHIPCTGLCNDGELCVGSTWACAPEDTSCGECGAGEGCVGGVCVAILDDPPDWMEADHPEGIGLYVSAGLLADGRPVLAYHDRTLGIARLAIHDGAAWSAATVEGDQYHDVGLYISMTIDASDVIHLTYIEALSGRNDLIYTQLDAAGGLLLREIVDNGNRDNGDNHDVGADSVIFFDGTTPTVLYQDGTTTDLVIAVRNGADDWTWSPLIEEDTNDGFFVDAAVDTDGTIWVAHYIYDWTADELSRVEAFALP